MMRILAIVYTTIAVAALLYAWSVDIWMLHSPVEHMLPDLLLYLVTLPLSLVCGPLYRITPGLFDASLSQVSLLTLCAAVQSAFLWLLSAKLRKKYEGDNQSLERNV